MNINNKEKDDVDKFHLFYVESIMSDSYMPQINSIKPIFENITHDEFIKMVVKIIEKNEHDTFQQFLYFLILFRDMEHLKKYINSEDFSLELLEKLVMFAYGYCTLHGYSTERIIDEILFFIDNERLMTLVMNSSYISKDKLLLFFVLSRFDVEMLNKYFSKVKNINEFIHYFLNLPDELLSSIITRNYHIFQYIMMMIAESDIKKEITTDFFAKYSADIEQLSRLGDISRKLKGALNKEESVNNVDQQKDSARISLLVNMMRDLPDPHKAINYFYNENVFKNETEKNIVLTVLTDPFFKNTYRNYEGILSTQD